MSMISTEAKPDLFFWQCQVLKRLGLRSYQLGVFLVLLFTGTSIASQGALNEGQAKASLLFNFAKFTTWPESAFHSKSEPLIIAIIGTNPFGDALKQFEGKRIKGRQIKIEHFSNPKEYTKSHILFCKITSRAELRSLIRNLKLEENHVLTVGDYSGFARAGGIIGLKFRGNRLALEYNSAAAKRANIYLSEQLVNLAEPVR